MAFSTVTVEINNWYDKTSSNTMAKGVTISGPGNEFASLLWDSSKCVHQRGLCWNWNTSCQIRCYEPIPFSEYFVFDKI